MSEKLKVGDQVFVVDNPEDVGIISKKHGGDSYDWWVDFKCSVSHVISLPYRTEELGKLSEKTHATT